MRLRREEALGDAPYTNNDDAPPDALAAVNASSSEVRSTPSMSMSEFDLTFLSKSLAVMKAMPCVSLRGRVGGWAGVQQLKAHDEASR